MCRWFTATLKGACGAFGALFPKLTKEQGHCSDSSAAAPFQRPTRVHLHKATSRNELGFPPPVKHLAEFQIDNVSSQN